MINIDHEIKIQATPEKVFAALSHIDQLKKWHTAHIEGIVEPKGVLTFQGKDKPTFQWEIVKLQPQEQVVWKCVKGPGDSVGTKAIYRISKTDDNRTLVEFQHEGWKTQEDNFRKCNTLWGILLQHLKKYVETGLKDPAFP